MSNPAEFLKELEALLAKYDAHVEVEEYYGGHTSALFVDLKKVGRVEGCNVYDQEDEV